ncbi:hypothetical protein GMD78_19475 [Ornithinibacillus sp. L9]|uniref:Phospholipid phosphatase n=1 Tax=Ornithinibacillus caprae TaxID=2678566 RepID=A0A6N8FMX2_9BACI|nr:hypothetical protein [Ornithinibacillus caprae]MUK90541.1 hypothetical protein [Ornithinibacillus caprae]
MDAFIYISFFAIYICIFIFGIRIAIREQWPIRAYTIFIVIIGLLYDNGILALGRYVGEGTMLEILHLARYWLHAFATPLLVIFAWDLLINSHVNWVKKQWVKYSFLLFTIGLILLELVTVVFKISLKPSWQYGVINYENIDPSGDSPFMIIIVSTVLAITSIIIWRKQKWIWLFNAVLLMGIASAVKLPIESNAVTNLAELILIIALLATKSFLHNRKGTSDY